MMNNLKNVQKIPYFIDILQEKFHHMILGSEPATLQIDADLDSQLFGSRILLNSFAKKKSCKKVPLSNKVK